MPDIPKEFDVRTNAEWQKLGWTAESLPKIEVEAEQVPPEFRHLIPYVKQWAITCDVRRGDFFEKQRKEDRRAFYHAIAAVEATLNQWIDTLPRDRAKLQFLTMMKGYCEVACEFDYDERQKKKA